MDHAATTPLHPDVFDEMRPYLTDYFGNASSHHYFGELSKSVLEKYRGEVAKVFGALTDEIIFTSGGTESDNLAIKGVAFANKERNHIITSAIEHHAVLNTCKYLEKFGFNVTYLPVDEYGSVHLGELEDAITEKTCLITIMHVNNEIGTVEPIEEIGKIAKDHKVYFHTDAVQSFGKLPIDVNRLNIDMLSVSGHKIYGPKGIGFLYIRKGTKIDPLLHGGGHEMGMRSGTVNVPAIVGLSKAVEIARETMGLEADRLRRLTEKLIASVLEIKGSRLNGHPIKRLAGNVNFCFTGVNGEAVVAHLDLKGIAASTGSACSSDSVEPSHVLLATGLSPEEAQGSLRLTLGKENTEEDVEYVLEVLPKIIGDLRKTAE